MEVTETVGLNCDGEPELQTGGEHAATALVRVWLLDADGKVDNLTNLVWSETHKLSAVWLNEEGGLRQHPPGYERFDRLDEWCLQRFAATVPVALDTLIFNDNNSVLGRTALTTFYTVPTALPGVEYAMEVEITLA